LLLKLWYKHKYAQILTSCFQRNRVVDGQYEQRNKSTKAHYDGPNHRQYDRLILGREEHRSYRTHDVQVAVAEQVVPEQRRVLDDIVHDGCGVRLVYTHAEGRILTVLYQRITRGLLLRVVVMKHARIVHECRTTSPARTSKTAMNVSDTAQQSQRRRGCRVPSFFSVLSAHFT